jgi:hypothetical protein
MEALRAKKKDEKKQCFEYFLIDPNEKWNIAYEGYMTLVNFWACVISAWMTIFELGDSAWVQILDIIVFVSFALDITFTLCKQYRDVSGVLVKSHKMIFIRYLKSGWFFIDVVSTFPF